MSHFSNRSQSVRINGALSTWRPVKAGVIQGSVIGPLLFLAYFDKVAPDLAHGFTTVKYADDLLLLRPINNAVDEASLQSAVNTIVANMDNKKLHVNSQKCEHILISQSSAPYNPSAPPAIHGTPIPLVNAATYLGVTIDNKLTWSNNTSTKCAKAKRAVGALKRLVKNKLNRSQLRTLVVSKVVPLFTYGLTATYPRNKCDRIALERLNRYITQTISNNYRLPYLELLEQTGIMPIYQNVIHRRILLAHSYVRGRRHLPVGTWQFLRHNEYLRRRSHNWAASPVSPTGLMVRNSAMEDILQCWNSMPFDFADLTKIQLRDKLVSSAYVDNSEEALSMRTAVMQL